MGFHQITTYFVTKGSQILLHRCHSWQVTCPAGLVFHSPDREGLQLQPGVQDQAQDRTVAPQRQGRGIQHQRRPRL